MNASNHFKKDGRSLNLLMPKYKFYFLLFFYQLNLETQINVSDNSQTNYKTVQIFLLVVLSVYSFPCLASSYVYISDIFYFVFLQVCVCVICECVVKIGEH